MNLGNFKSFLPLILFYSLIFMDPYSYLIPIKEPKLVYDEKVTWLLDGKNGQTDFAVAYNEKYANSLLDKKNAFREFYPYLYKDYESKPGYEFLKKYEIKDSSELRITAKEDFLKLVYEKKTDKFIDNSFDNPTLLKYKEALLKIYEKIELGDKYSFYEEPLLFNQENYKQIESQIMVFVFGLYYFSENKENVKSALAQLRLLSNTFDKDRLLLILDIYKKIIDRHNISADEIADLEADLPQWPDLKDLLTRIDKASLFLAVIHPNEEFKKNIAELRQINQDIYLNQSITLKQLGALFDQFDNHLPDAKLNDLPILIMAKKICTKWHLVKKGDKRTLAERVLFSLSIKDQFEKLATLFSRSLGLVEMFYLDKISERMNTIYAKESKGKKDER